MIRRFALITMLVLSTTGAIAEAREQAYPCYWVRGRLMAYNGNPTFRIWPRGTHRLLGVINWDDRANKEIEIPPSVWEAYGGRNTFEKELWGNFRVCPLAPERPGRMRPVDLVDARILAIRDYAESHR
jgi:hypothetical protein